jgi:phage recombination protein Bet
MNAFTRPELFPPASSAFQHVELTPAQLALVWDMNRKLSRREFDQFIETSRSMGLNPLKRQICAIVLNEGDARRRHFAIVTTISGLRSIADRTGTYRPDGRPARITIDETAKHARANPLGIVDCIVTPHRFSQGRWHRIVGQVWWDEIAPIRRGGDGELHLDSRTPWPIRPRGQIIKCAEAAALRAGWPDTLANVYAEDEMDRARSDEGLPSDLAIESNRERQQARNQPRGTILIDMQDGEGLVSVPVDTFHKRVGAFIASRLSATDLAGVLAWREQQRSAFQEFHHHNRKAALDLKRQFEAIQAQVAVGSTAIPPASVIDVAGVVDLGAQVHE